VVGQTGVRGVPVLSLAMEDPKHEPAAAPILRRQMVEGSALGLPQRLGSVVQWLALFLVRAKQMEITKIRTIALAI